MPAHYSVLIAACVSCVGTVPEGSSCTQSSDCESGLQCLYPLGSGCSAKGQCLVPTNDCSFDITGLSLCACPGTVIDWTCVPSNAALGQRSATGTACGADAGAPDALVDAQVDAGAGH